MRIIIVLCSLLLWGCSQDKNLQYFMTHPEKIKSAISKCNGMDPDVAAANDICLAAVMAQQKILSSLRTIRNSSAAQALGRRVIRTQRQLVKNQQALQKAERDLADLEQQPAAADKITAMKKRIVAIQKIVVSQQQAVLRYYALIRLLGE